MICIQVKFIVIHLISLFCSVIKIIYYLVIIQQNKIISVL